MVSTSSTTGSRSTTGLRGLLAAAALLAVAAACGEAPVDGPAAAGTPSTYNSARVEPVPSDLASLVESYNAPQPAPRTSAPPATKPTPTAPVADRRTFGADVSWPQCPKGMGIPEKRTQGQPMPTAAAQFLIMGLTNGPSFTPNPCLADQVRWGRERRLMLAAYAVHSYPDAATLARTKGEGPYDARDRLGALRNSGYQAARFNVATMQKAGLRSPIVWVDVEPVPTFVWSSDKVANAAVVEGALRGYADAGLQVGFYSTPRAWREIVGPVRYGKPEWRAAGMSPMAEALNRCGPDWSFQGGPAVFGQWVEANRDRNVTCPGMGRDLGRWFETP